MEEKQYHIDKNGLPAICRARVRPCPRKHFPTKEQAQEFLDKQNLNTPPKRKKITGTRYFPVTKQEFVDEWLKDKETFERKVREFYNLEDNSLDFYNRKFTLYDDDWLVKTFLKTDGMPLVSLENLNINYRSDFKYYVP